MEELGEDEWYDYIFDKYENIYQTIHREVKKELEHESLRVREAVIERLSDEFRFWYIFD